MPRLPIALRGFRPAGAGGDGLRDAGRDEHRQRAGRAGGRRRRAGRSARRGGNRRRDRGGEAAPGGAAGGRHRARSRLHLGGGGTSNGRGLPRGGRMIDVLLDADVLGRQLPAAAPDLRFAAVTRHPELVPDGIEPLALSAGSQELRMAWRLPRLLRRVKPRLGHYQHSLPLRGTGRSVLTVHDLSFERDPTLMPRKDRLVFKAAVPRSARKADRVIAVSQRTREDLAELYGLTERIRVIPHGVDPAFSPGDGGPQGFLLFVGAVQQRKDPQAALEAARDLQLPLVIVGPEREAPLAAELRRLGADVRGYV